MGRVEQLVVLGLSLGDSRHALTLTVRWRKRVARTHATRASLTSLPRLQDSVPQDSIPGRLGAPKAARTLPGSEGLSPRRWATGRKGRLPGADDERAKRMPFMG